MELGPFLLRNNSIDKHVTALSHIADRHYIIAKGQVVWSGTSAALRTDTPLRQRYLGV